MGYLPIDNKGSLVIGYALHVDLSTGAAMSMQVHDCELWTSCQRNRLDGNTERYETHTRSKGWLEQWTRCFSM